MFSVSWLAAQSRRCKVEFVERDGGIRVTIHTFEAGCEIPARTESGTLVAVLPHLFKPTGRYRFTLHHLNLADIAPDGQDLFRQVVNVCHDMQRRRGVSLAFERAGAVV